MQTSHLGHVSSRLPVDGFTRALRSRGPATIDRNFVAA